MQVLIAIILTLLFIVLPMVLAMPCRFNFHKWSKWTEVLTDGSITTHSHDKKLKFQRRACTKCGLIQRRNL